MFVVTWALQGVALPFAAIAFSAPLGSRRELSALIAYVVIQGAAVIAAGLYINGQG